MAVGAGFQDVRLQIDLAEVQNRQTYYRQREITYQRRMQREDQQYEYKRAVDEYERRREQAGARMVRVLASNLPKDEMYKAIMGLQEEFPNVDLTETGAGKIMLGGRFAGPPQYSLEYYKNLGLTGGQPQQALERKHLGAEGRPVAGAMTSAEELEAKYRKAKTAAVNADDPESVEFWDRKLRQTKGTAPLAEAELQGGMTDRIAVDKAGKHRGYDPGNVQTVAPAKGWTPEQYGNELAGMYGDILGGPDGKQQTAQFSDPRLQAIWEKAKKQGVTIEQFRAELNE